MYRYLPDMLPYFTTDGRATKIHACKWQVSKLSWWLWFIQFDERIYIYPLNPISGLEITFLLQANRHDTDSDLPCGQSIFPARKMKVLRIKPATMWVALSTEGMPADFKRYVNLLTLKSQCYFFYQWAKECRMFGFASYLKETPVNFLAREKILFCKSATCNASVSHSNLVPMASVTTALQRN